jgi:hypothetical protein
VVNVAAVAVLAVVGVVEVGTGVEFVAVVVVAGIAQRGPENSSRNNHPLVCAVAPHSPMARGRVQGRRMLVVEGLRVVVVLGGSYHPLR